MVCLISLCLYLKKVSGISVKRPTWQGPEGCQQTQQGGCKQILQPSLEMTAAPANIFYFYFYIDFRELEKEKG